MGQWQNLPFDAKLFSNVQESCLSKNGAALENAFANEAGGYTRFPGLASFATLTGKGPTYLAEWRGDLIAVSSSRVWRIKEDGSASDVTGIPVSGNGRVIFAKTPNELTMAAGGMIVRLAAEKTDILSDNAPLSTHVGYLEGYLMAIEMATENMYHCAANDFPNWDPLDVFSADSFPDQLKALMVTPYREVILAGEDSVEQFERLSTSSETPFARRWSVGEGVAFPYTLTFADNGIWCINKRREFVRASGQVSKPVSDDIGNSLQNIDDFTNAWAVPVLIHGQKFILLQMPHATNTYGTKGQTFLFDYRQNRWTTLFGWNAEDAIPERWPGWSYFTLWGRHFVGGDGQVFELKSNSYQNNGEVQRVLIRSGHYDGFGQVRIDNLRLRLKRGLANSNSDESQIGIRVRRDASAWSRWKFKKLGRSGETEQHVTCGGFGCGDSFQIEVLMTDAAEFELVNMQAQMTRLVS
jgi:hypothetical protein